MKNNASDKLREPVYRKGQLTELFEEYAKQQQIYGYAGKNSKSWHWDLFVSMHLAEDAVIKMVGNRESEFFTVGHYLNSFH